jgi:type IV pilus assembly protein PilE
VDYIRRGQRAQGQQFLLDLGQRQEQYLLDNRAYAPTLAALAPGMTPPAEVAARYTDAVFTVTAGPPPTFKIALSPIGTGTLAGDGTLFIDSTQVRWRAVSPTDAGYTSNDCRWEETRCKPS